MMIIVNLMINIVVLIVRARVLIVSDIEGNQANVGDYDCDTLYSYFFGLVIK